jgi:small toxic polypeptide LdrA/B/C/D
MMRYVILDIVFVALAGCVAYTRRKQLGRPGGYALKLTVFLLLLTLCFDNLIIVMNIVTYTPGHVLGVYMGKAPIEDFAYTLAAILLVGALWEDDHAA